MFKETFQDKSDRLVKTSPSESSHSCRFGNQKRAELIESFIPLVRHLVERFVLFTPPDLTREDLVSSGIVGLIQAIDRYSPREGASLKTYVGIRVRGAILDELRRHQLSTRRAHAYAKQLSEVQNKIAQSLGREPSEEEVRKELKMSASEFETFLEKAKPVWLLSLDQPLGGGESSQDLSLQDILADRSLRTPDENAITSDDVQLIKKLLYKLPPAQIKVLKMFYLDGLRGKEISVLMKLTESRISQLHTLGLNRLRNAFFAVEN